jgi:hypothetical protein
MVNQACFNSITENGVNGGEPVSYRICCSKAYSQTLFLGCSIQSFTVGLGWGGEGSRLTVELVRDTCKYPHLINNQGQTISRNNSPNDYTNRRKNSSFEFDENGIDLIPGKVYYEARGNELVSLYHFDEDPGFYGDLPPLPRQSVNPQTLDLIGTPVYFKYDDFEFNGIVKSWEKGADQSTVNESYTVTIESPSFLLQQTYMILSSYVGSIFTKKSGFTKGFPDYEYGTYGGKILEQNIPNVINIYGYLEDNTNITSNQPLLPESNVPDYIYGKSGWNEQGMPAPNIFVGINDLLNYQPIATALTQQKILRYSPYGRIIGRGVKYKIDGTNVIASEARSRKHHIGIVWPLIYSGTYGPEHRMPYEIDISSLNDGSIPSFYRISDETMTILDFVQKIAGETGKEIFISLNLRIDGGVIYPVIKLNTISTLEYGRIGAVESFIKYLKDNGKTLQSYNTGLEFNSSDPVRSMYIGGKQQRLYQVRNKKYASKQSSLRYNSFLDKFINVQQQHTELNAQEIRAANPVSTRNPVLKYNKTTDAGSRSGRVRIPLIDDFNTAETFGKTIQKGNYFTKKSLNPIGIIPMLSDLGMSPQSNWFEVSSGDTICPYFGNNLITNLVRKVYYHQTGFIVEFSTQEIGLAIGQNFATNDIIGVSETEIRAAMSGFDSYYGFIFGVMSDAKTIGKNRGDRGNSALQIYSKVIMPLFNIPAAHDINTYFGSLNRGVAETNNKINNSLSGSQAVPIAPGSSFASDKTAYDILSKLHKFFQDIGNTYYGKQFMVSINTMQYFKDTNTFMFDPTVGINCDNSIVIGFTDNNNPIYLSDGTSKIYYEFEPADFAWEEYFNFVDDMLVVGSPDMDNLTADNGTIYPILGYSAHKQYNYIKEFDKRVWDQTRNFSGNASQFFHFWKFDAYRNAGAKFLDPSNNFWEPSISLQDDSAVTLEYNKNIYQNPTSPQGLCSPVRTTRVSSDTDAFDTIIPETEKFKTYVKAEIDKEIQSYFASALIGGGRIIPKLIIKHNTGAFINPLHPGALSVTSAVVEFLGNNYGGLNAVIGRKILSGSSFYSVPFQTAGFNADSANSQNRDNNQYNNMSINPKAAIPIFAGVPMIINNAVYGPWVSAPDVIKNDIFGTPYTDPATGQTVYNPNVDVRLENLVGGTKVQVDGDLVPWNYGGMRLLDEAALIQVSQDNNYQLQSETGQITVYGTPEVSIGDELKATSYAFRGPTVTNVQVQVGENGGVTTYTFRTFTRKFTLFNKESADRLRTIGQNAIKSQKEFRQQFRKINEMLMTAAGSSSSATNPYDLSGSKLGQYSPMTVLVGYSHPYTSPLRAGNIGFYPRPGSPAQYSKDSVRQLTTVSLQDVRELPQEFDHLYSTKAFMSLEGLLSPVSFYPTFNNSTNAYKPYFTDNCPICNGTRQYSFGNKTLFCIFCNDKVAGQDPGLPETNIQIPPYILSSELTDSVIDNPNAVAELLWRSVGKTINYINLNPIIMPVGELRNRYAQSTDFTAHHIDIVGRSLVPMAGSLSITDNTCIDQDQIFGNLNLADQNGSIQNGIPPSDLDWNSYAFDLNSGTQSNRFYLMNQRFLALRGPLVLSGWGFDTEGYPVPNSSGEPQQLDDEGFPKRIQNPQDQNGGFQNYEGTILGKNQIWDEEKQRWSDPYREDTFYKGWGLRPDTWPVGPVDLRWDHRRKVWTAAPEVMFAEVQLEDDLSPPTIARGFLNYADEQAPLPNNLKRMVLVKDFSETFGAPRGAKLYCKYDSVTGFYTPVTRQNIITSGLITSPNTAIIYNGYAQGYGENNVPHPPQKIPVQYLNFLNLPINNFPNQAGLFIYITNQWILMSTNCD